MKNREKYLLKITIWDENNLDSNTPLGELENIHFELNHDNKEYWQNKLKVIGNNISFLLENFFISQIKNKKIENITSDPSEKDSQLKNIKLSESTTNEKNKKSNKSSFPNRILFRKKAFDSAKAHAGSELKNEVAGILLGKYFSDPNGDLITLVSGIVRAPEAIENAATIEIPVESLVMIWKAIEDDPIYSNSDEWGWVGYYHTHPDYGVFYSHTDTENFKKIFTAKFHVGMVIDPVRNEFGFFGWNLDQSDVVRLPDTKIEIVDDINFRKILTENTGFKGQEIPLSELFAGENQFNECHIVDDEEADYLGPILGPR